MRCPDKAGRHEPYESRGSRADLWEPEAAMPPATGRRRITRPPRANGIRSGREPRRGAGGGTPGFALGAQGRAMVTACDAGLSGWCWVVSLSSFWVPGGMGCLRRIVAGGGSPVSPEISALDRSPGDISRNQILIGA